MRNRKSKQIFPENKFIESPNTASRVNLIDDNETEDMMHVRKPRRNKKPRESPMVARHLKMIEQYTGQVLRKRRQILI